MTGEIAAPLLRWFDENKRDLPWRRDRDPYHIWISEIMLQQTRVEAVIPYYERFLQACPTVADLAAAEEAVYLKLWEGLGYYSRVRNLHKAACLICEKWGGRFPENYADLLALPGVGPYTAGAIGSIAFDLPVPAVDGNVLRVTARLDDDSRPITDPKVKADMTERVRCALPSQRAGDFNQALMELGAVVCIPNGAPRCGVCPVQHLCAARAQGTAAGLPRRAPKKTRKIEQRTVLVLRHERLVGLRQRPAGGLLGGLWELPAYEGALSAEEVREKLTRDGFSVRQVLSLRPAKHIFTHIEWHMTGYYVELDAAGNGLEWVLPAQLHDRYTLPSAFRAFVRVLEGDDDGV